MASAEERISQQLADVAGKLVADYWDNNGGDVRAIVDGSLLMDYDEAGVEMQFKSAAAISVTYTLLEAALSLQGGSTRTIFRQSTISQPLTVFTPSAQPSAT